MSACEQIDLNISNYGVEELLNLFKINADFGLADLKRVKRQALQFHPDKSGLSNEYFIFFMKAYRIIKDIWIFKNKMSSDRNDVSEFDDKEHLDAFFAKHKDIDFQKWFNEQFEKVYIKNDQGYEEWFRNDSQKDVKSVKNNDVINSLSTYQTISALHSSSTFGYDLVDVGSNKDYSNESILYSDLVEAHTFTKLEPDMQKQHFENASDLKQYRSTQQLNLLTTKESTDYLQREALLEEELATRRAYELIRQSSMIKERKQLVESSWKRLK